MGMSFPKISKEHGTHSHSFAICWRSTLTLDARSSFLQGVKSQAVRIQAGAPHSNCKYTGIGWNAKWLTQFNILIHVIRPVLAKTTFFVLHSRVQHKFVSFVSKRESMLQNFYCMNVAFRRCSSMGCFPKGCTRDECAVNFPPPHVYFSCVRIF